MDQQDAFWVERARRGDRAAFGLLVEKHSPALLRAIARRAGPEDAPDLAQEAWIRAFLNLDRLRDPARFGAWLAGIGANVARMWLRARQPAGTSWEALSDDQAQPRGNGLSPDEQVALRELQGEVLTALEALSTANRDAARLHYLDHRSYREIAERLRIPEKTVKSRLHKARQQLRKRLRHVVELPAELPRGVSSMIDAHVYEVYEGERLEDLPAAVGAAKMCIVVLKSNDRERYLPIWVGGWEAQSIARILRGAPRPRPMTHELIVELFKRLGHNVESVDISALRDNTYIATLRVSGNNDVEEFDCRPSDGLPVAIGLGAPIRIAPEVLEQAGSDTWDDLKHADGNRVSPRPLELEDVLQPRQPKPGDDPQEERKPLT